MTKGHENSVMTSRTAEGGKGNGELGSQFVLGNCEHLCLTAFGDKWAVPGYEPTKGTWEINGKILKWQALEFRLKSGVDAGHRKFST